MSAARGCLKHDGGYRVLVYGGRTYAPRVGPVPLADPERETARLKAVREREFVFRVLDKIHRQRGILCLISGCACAFCHSTERLTVDHIHPYSKGGTDDPSNLQCLCFWCNLRKSNRVA